MNALRTTARLARCASRPSLVKSHTPIIRAFGSTPTRRASEDSDSFMAAFKNSPMFNRFAEKPEALEALSKMAEFLKKNEIDMSGPPSSMTLFKLATNSEFRELVRNAMAELRKAGIDIKPENAMELFSPPKDPKGPR